VTAVDAYGRCFQWLKWVGNWERLGTPFPGPESMQCGVPGPYRLRQRLSLAMIHIDVASNIFFFLLMMSQKIGLSLRGTIRGIYCLNYVIFDIFCYAMIPGYQHGPYIRVVCTGLECRLDS